MFLFGASSDATSQEPPDSLRAAMGRLTTVVDSLRAEVARLAPGGPLAPTDDPLAELRAAAAAAAAGGAPSASPEPQQFAGRERSLQALNPEISVTGDVFGFLNPDNANADNFGAREFEIAMQSSLDPFSRAKIFISRHAVGPEVVPFAEAGHEDEEEHSAGFDLEEGYVEWVGLPGGLALKVGKFQQRFGTLNRWHSHALPFQSRSLPHLAYLGEEALAQTGASFAWLAPIGGGRAGTYEASVEVVRSSHELFGESTRPSVLGHVNGFWQFGASTDLELNLSWVNGSYEDSSAFFDRDVYGVEFAFNWIPPALTRQRGLTVRGGAMVLEGLLPEEDDPGGVADPDGRALGIWSMAEMRISPSWLVGARFDRAENPHDPATVQTLLSPTLTWWQSEFVRVRAEYDVLSSFDSSGTTGLFALQLTFAMGPHKHESY
jgi:hypothetical protein